MKGMAAVKLEKHGYFLCGDNLKSVRKEAIRQKRKIKAGNIN